MAICKSATCTASPMKTILKFLFTFTFIFNCQAAINDTRIEDLTILPEVTNFTCTNRALGSYYPDFESKCQKFHLCAKGEEGEVLNLSFLCTEGSAFDERAADCLPTDTVICNPNDTEITSLRSTRRAQKELKNSTPTYKTSFKCSGKKLGRYYADPETNCRLFHLCTIGQSKIELFDFQFLCLFGTAFDDGVQRCIEQSQVSCGSKPPKKFIPSLPILEEVTTQLPPPTNETSVDEETETAATTEEEETTTTDAEMYFYEDYDDLPMEMAEESLRKKRSNEPLRVERLWKIRGPAKKRSKRAPVAPSLDIDNLPPTSFTCADKVIGGYYADIETGCQMYHVCSQGSDGKVQDFKFLCSNGTIFSQQTRTCQTWYTIDCASTLQFATLNEELPRVAVDEANVGIDVIRSRRPQQSHQVQSNQQVFVQSETPRGAITRTQLTQRQQQQQQQQFIAEDNTRLSQQSPQQQTQISASQDAFGDLHVLTPSTQRTSGGRVGKRRRLKSRKRVQQNVLPSEVTTIRTTTPAAEVVQDNTGFGDQFSGLLEELHVRGRFSQDEANTARQVQRTNVQQQQEVAVVPQTRQQQSRLSQQLVSAQQQSSSSVNQQVRQQVTDDAPRTRLVSSTSLREPAPQPAFQDTADVFPGFDSFITLAIQEEQKQREQFRRLQEERRLRGELEEPTTSTSANRLVESHVQATLRSAPTRRVRPIPAAVTAGNDVVTDAPARISAATQRTAQRTQITQTLAPSRVNEVETFRTPISFRTSSTPLPSLASSAILPELHELPLFESSPRQPVAQSRITNRPQFQPITLTEPSVNIENLMLQQLSTRQQLQSTTPISVPRQQSVNIDGLLLQQLNTPPQPPARVSLNSVQQPPWHNVNLEALLLQQTTTPQPTTRFVPQAINNNALFLQQIPTRQQQQSSLNLPMTELLFLVPSQSQLTPNWAVGGQLMQLNTPFSSGFDWRIRQRRSPQQQQRTSTRPTQFFESDFLRLPVSSQVSTTPSTSFSCKGKVLGGYYADVETDCKMFHVCTPGQEKLHLDDFRFLCANDTVFDQRSQTCSSPERVKCRTSPAYYPKIKLAEEEHDVPVPNAEIFRVRVKRAIAGVEKVNPSDVPNTGFNCQGRENGRFYADPQTNCRLFHLCTEVKPGGWLKEHAFLCPNGTVFDQRSQACDDQTDALNCQEDPMHYGIDEGFARRL